MGSSAGVTTRLCGPSRRAFRAGLAFPRSPPALLASGRTGRAHTPTRWWVPSRHRRRALPARPWRTPRDPRPSCSCTDGRGPGGAVGRPERSRRLEAQGEPVELQRLRGVGHGWGRPDVVVYERTRVTTFVTTGSLYYLTPMPSEAPRLTTNPARGGGAGAAFVVRPRGLSEYLAGVPPCAYCLVRGRHPASAGFGYRDDSGGDRLRVRRLDRGLLRHRPVLPRRSSSRLGGPRGGSPYDERGRPAPRRRRRRVGRRRAARLDDAPSTTTPSSDLRIEDWAALGGRARRAPGG